MTQLTIKTYSELQKIKSFDERFDYLRLDGVVGKSTFGFDRYLNQILYRSHLWLRARDKVIIRDNGCDLGISDRSIVGRIIIHHINPISIDNIRKNDPTLIDPEFLICVSHNTHLAIHYGDKSLLPEIPINRHSGDTFPWDRFSYKKE